ncbi:MAG: ABC transporter ATP-binding protein [Candidatus Eremiobacterota bacterium]
MQGILFFYDIFKKFPFLISINVIILGIVGTIEATSVLTIVPVIDFFLKTSDQNYSVLTKKIIEIINFFGIKITLSNLVFIFLGINLLALIFQIYVKYLAQYIRYTVLRNIIHSTFCDIFNANWYFFSSTKQGILLNTFISEFNNIGGALGAMANFFAELFLLILYCILPFYLSWKVALISLFTALILSLPFFLLSRYNYSLGQLNLSTVNKMTSVIQEGISMAKIILGFGKEKTITDNFLQSFNNHCSITIKFQTILMSIPLMYYYLGLAVIIITLHASQKLLIPVSITVALIYSLQKIMVTVGRLAAYKNSLDNFFPSYEQLLRLSSQAKKLKRFTGIKQFTGIKNEILIEKLSFSYPGNKTILSDINIHIPRGKIIAIVGQSGSGKTTLIDIIMGFYEATSGEITIDGIPLKDIDINSYRQKIGYVPQDSVLFNNTIKANLLWANEKATMKEIEEACKQSNAYEFIKEFPSGYDTVVGDRGIRLSGGQIQRIALARAIIRKPDILIMDEATSSLDTHSERLIQEAIENIAKETTVIAIAHRLSTIINADYIYVIINGHIIEEGKYSELLEKKKEFYRMVNLQKL